MDASGAQGQGAMGAENVLLTQDTLGLFRPSRTGLRAGTAVQEAGVPSWWEDMAGFRNTKMGISAAGIMDQRPAACLQLLGPS